MNEADDAARAREEVSGPYPRWAETIDSVDGGKTIRIPGYAPDGSETAGIIVSREKASELVDMIDDFLGGWAT